MLNRGIFCSGLVRAIEKEGMRAEWSIKNSPRRESFLIVILSGNRTRKS